MTIGFFTVFRKDPRHFLMARRMLLSAKCFMPDVEVVQLTDEKTPEVPGVNRVQRKPHGRMLERRLEHYADNCGGDWLFVDTDVVFQADVRDAFGYGLGDVYLTKFFDVALTDRQWPHIQHPAGFVEEMPFNTGVCFSRCPDFWRAVLETWRAFTPEQQADWMSEQRAVAHVVRTEPFNVLVLPGMVYNYPPTTLTDVGLAEAKIVHFKGPLRKALKYQAVAS